MAGLSIYTGMGRRSFGGMRNGKLKSGRRRGTNRAVGIPCIHLATNLSQSLAKMPDWLAEGVFRSSSEAILLRGLE